MVDHIEGLIFSFDSFLRCIMNRHDVNFSNSDEEQTSNFFFHFLWHYNDNKLVWNSSNLTCLKMENLNIELSIEEDILPLLWLEQITAFSDFYKYNLLRNKSTTLSNFISGRYLCVELITWDRVGAAQNCRIFLFLRRRTWEFCVSSFSWCSI